MISHSDILQVYTTGGREPPRLLKSPCGTLLYIQDQKNEFFIYLIFCRCFGLIWDTGESKKVSGTTIHCAILLVRYYANKLSIMKQLCNIIVTISNIDWPADSISQTLVIVMSSFILDSYCVFGECLK